MKKLSEHFDEDEFKCPHCGEVKVNPVLVETLEDIRKYTDIPMKITSGYRCAAHNAAVGGKPSSAHLAGDAADFAVFSDKDRFKFLEAIFIYGPVRIGIGKDFIHVDVSLTLPHEVVWAYGND